MKVKFIPADLTRPMELREIADHDKLTSVQEALGGNCYVESVRLGRFPNHFVFHHNQTQEVPPDGSLFMIVDDEGLRKQLPHNYRASALYGTQFHGKPIAGDAILVGQDYDEDGELDWADYPLEV